MSDMAEIYGLALPYAQISAMGSACASHSEIDGFIAHWRDEVWQYITPPNGPDPCYCTVTHLLESDVPPGHEGRRPGVERLPASTIERCRQYGLPL